MKLMMMMTTMSGQSLQDARKLQDGPLKTLNKILLYGLITDRVVRYCCQNDISEIKTSNNPVKKTTAYPLAGVSR